MDRDLLRDSQKAIRESQIGLVVDLTLDKHNSWYEEGKKNDDGLGEDDDHDSEEIKRMLTHCVDK